MPHYWFSHRANSQLNVPSQWSKTDIIQPWPPFPAWHIEINVLLNKAAYFWALPRADGLIVVNKIFFFLSISQGVYTEAVRMSGSICEHPNAQVPRYGAFIFLCRALREVLWPCCGVRCCLGENCTIGTQSQRQPCEKEKMSVDEMKSETAAFVTRGVRDLECPWQLGSYALKSSDPYKHKGAPHVSPLSVYASVCLATVSAHLYALKQPGYS